MEREEDWEALYSAILDRMKGMQRGDLSSIMRDCKGGVGSAVVVVEARGCEETESIVSIILADVFFVKVLD